MNKLFVICMLSASLEAASSVSLLNALIRCPSQGNYILASVSGSITCVALPSNVQVNGNPPALSVAAPAVTPQWQADTFSLSSLAPGASSISVASTKTPLTGFVLLLYSSTSILNPGVSVLAWGGNPVAITLPQNWLPADSITILYQWQ